MLSFEFNIILRQLSLYAEINFLAYPQGTQANNTFPFDTNLNGKTPYP